MLKGFWKNSRFGNIPTSRRKCRLYFLSIRSYVGIGVTDPTAYLRFSISDQGLSSSTFGKEGSSFVEAYTAGNDVYAAYSSASRILDQQDEFICSTMDEIIKEDQGEVSANKSSNQVFKTFRLAMSAQAEYSQYHITRANATGATDDEKKIVVLAAINNTVTRVNALYEKDLAVHFNLIDVLKVIYLVPATDPYTGDFNTEVQSVLTEEIGAANYDIGHLLAYAGPNGNAG